VAAIIRHFAIDQQLGPFFEINICIHTAPSYSLTGLAVQKLCERTRTWKW
jgi:hypothetical protein